jgi:hypothetical protein
VCVGVGVHVDVMWVALRWQGKMRSVTSSGRISDTDLQICQKIWHEKDDDGCGVSAAAVPPPPSHRRATPTHTGAGEDNEMPRPDHSSCQVGVDQLGGVLESMLLEGAISIAPNGSVVIAAVVSTKGGRALTGVH